MERGVATTGCFSPGHGGHRSEQASGPTGRFWEVGAEASEIQYTVQHNSRERGHEGEMIPHIHSPCSRHEAATAALYLHFCCCACMCDVTQKHFPRRLQLFPSHHLLLTLNYSTPVT